ncbi:hypothetical protein CCACVL1_19687 [Corchorus capsularis]|uniref:Uncharacterized protein n=1 Tax=Corchorus capsularis TaxID=210143 RepID=A0A1R3HFE8_COCAP|nr:hypothetical protein CCACVL1_19687 [Corchorus capsularis]
MAMSCTLAGQVCSVLKTGGGCPLRSLFRCLIQIWFKIPV